MNEQYFKLVSDDITKIIMSDTDKSIIYINDGKHVGVNLYPYPYKKRDNEVLIPISKLQFTHSLRCATTLILTKP